MKCPKCGIETKIIDSRENSLGTQVRRRHACHKCKGRFTTFERRFDDALEQKLKLAEDTISAILLNIDTMRLRMARVQNTKTRVKIEGEWKV